MHLHSRWGGNACEMGKTAVDMELFEMEEPFNVRTDVTGNCSRCCLVFHRNIGLMMRRDREAG